MFMQNVLNYAQRTEHTISGGMNHGQHNGNRLLSRRRNGTDTG